MAIDQPYVAPLCVTVLSLLEHLRPGFVVDLYLMESGLAAETRRTLQTAFDERVAITWLSIDKSKFASLHRSVASAAANFRLLAGSSLPSSTTRVIYLDADLLIQRDLVELWERDMGGNIILAAQDGYLQTLPRLCLPSNADRHVARPYFNSGVMMIDLASWRTAGIEDACLVAARRLQHRSRWVDQDALNACLADHWGALPPVWNKQYWIDLVPDAACSPYEEQEFEAARRFPAIIHFCSRTKPWHPFCDHPPTAVLAYRNLLRRTPFGAAAMKPASFRQTFVERFAAPHRRLLDRLAAATHARSRGHALRVMLPAMLRLALRCPWTAVTVPLAIFGEQTRRFMAPHMRRRSL